MVIIIICYENISIYLIKINYFIGFVCFYALIIILISCTSLYSSHNFYKNNHETFILENQTKKPNRPNTLGVPQMLYRYILYI